MVLPQDDTDKEKPSEEYISPLPDWLKPDSPPGAEQLAPSMPDWLKAASPGPAPSPPELPAWLPAEARSMQSPPMPAPSAGLQAAPAEPEDDLSTLRASMAPSGIGDTPDWLAEVAPTEPGSGARPQAAPAEPEDDLSALRASMAPSGIGDTPDWLAEAAPTEPGSAAELASADMPDWLAEVSSPEPAPAEAPDWLSAAAPTEPTSPTELASADMPDWLAEVSPAEPAPAETPDWLIEVAPTEPGSAAELTSADMPDWLAEVSPAEPIAPSAQPIEPTAAIPAEALDWLADVPPADLASAGMSDLIKNEPAKLTPAHPAEAPDWLSDLGSAEPAQAAPADMPDLTAGGTPVEPAASPIPSDALDWLSGLAPLEPAAPSTEAPETEVPDWLSTLPGPGEPPAAAPEPSAPETEASDWLSTLPGPGEPPAAAPEPSAPETEAPDWLSTLPGPGEPPATAPEPSEPVTAEQPADDLFDWMSIDMGMTVPSSEPIGSGEDLLGLTSDLTPPSPEQLEAEMVEEAAAEASDLPEWWQSGQPPADVAWGEPSGASSDLLDQISDLRFDAIVGPGAQAASGEPEKVGALKDVVGVIQPEVVFEGGSLAAGGLAVESIITDDQNRRIERLERLLDAEQKETPLSAERRMALPLVRWLVAAVLIAAIAAPVIMGINVLPTPQTSSNAAGADQLLSALPDASTVLLAFEYEPESAAELQPLAVALLQRIGGREGMTIYAVSTRPTGPAMAENALGAAFPPEQGEPPGGETDEIEGSGMATPEPGSEAEAPAQERSGWINLGYVSGGANGISELVLGSPRGMPSRLGFDYQGQPTGITQTGLLEQPPALIVIVSARAEDLRPWIEQAGQVMDTPILVAAGAGSSPLALPYRRSGQVDALLIGVGDTLSYQSLAGGSPDPALVAMWNAQALGGLSAVLAIIVGGLFYGLTSWRKQQEQSR